VWDVSELASWMIWLLLFKLIPIYETLLVRLANLGISTQMVKIKQWVNTAIFEQKQGTSFASKEWLHNDR